MEYNGKELKKLGFGMMRPPMTGSNVDIEQVKRMTDMFLEAGFTYFDTAYGYLGGKSELAVNEALVSRHPRESFILATKLPAFLAKSADDAKQMLTTSLERTGAGYFDFYLLHNLGEKRTNFYDDYGIWDFLAEKKQQGVIRKLGFSFHDKADELDRILSAHPDMDFVQLQINYADWESPTVQSRLCYETARKHNKQIVIMEPVKGGNLARLPKPAADILRAAEPDMSLPSWGVRFASSLEGVITVLSGMSSIEQMQDNISYMQNFTPLDRSQLDTLKNVRELLETYISIPCTSCGYCMSGCPANVAISGIFQAVNNALLYDNMEGAKGTYAYQTKAYKRAGASGCIRCGRCERVCPQHIKIREELKKAAKMFD